MSKVKKRSGPAAGFSLVEILVVVIVCAVLAMMAVPGLMSIVPRFQLRQAAEATSSMMHMAKTGAAATQKPCRAVVDCRNSNLPCRLSVYNAVFNIEGKLTGWVETPDSARMLPSRVTATAQNTSPPPTVFTGNPSGLYWAVFLPSGRLLAASHDPLNLVLSAERISRNWVVSVDNINGLVTVARGS